MACGRRRFKHGGTTHRESQRGYIKEKTRSCSRTKGSDERHTCMQTKMCEDEQNHAHEQQQEQAKTMACDSNKNRYGATKIGGSRAAGRART